jgi:hypothetical protein
MIPLILARSLSCFQPILQRNLIRLETLLDEIFPNFSRTREKTVPSSITLTLTWTELSIFVKNGYPGYVLLGTDFGSCPVFVLREPFCVISGRLIWLVLPWTSNSIRITRLLHVTSNGNLESLQLYIEAIFHESTVRLLGNCYCQYILTPVNLM